MYITCTYMFRACMYLTVSTQDMFVLSTKAVDHVNNIGNTSMMEPEPVFLSLCD